MARKGKGLSDNARTGLILIFALFNSVSASLMALQGTANAPPVFVIITLNIIGNAVIVVTTQLGIRDATVSAVAKKVDPAYPTYRNPNPDDG